jgi:hypothetical protein
MRGQESKLIFLDSSLATRFDQTRVLVPPMPFSATGQDRIALSLQQLSIRRGWYNINETNSYFYLFYNNAYTEVQIPPGTYQTFESVRVALTVVLLLAIQNIAGINSVVVEFDEPGRLYVITFDVVVEVRTFQVKSGALPAGVVNGGYQDTHEILGTRPIRRVADATNSMVVNPLNALQIRSRYPCFLNTLDAIYVSLSTLETGNYASTSLSQTALEGIRLEESSIFARIPFDTSFFSEDFEQIQWQDPGNDLFQSFPPRQSLSQLEIRITDGRGRTLTQLDPQQADDGLLKFTMVLRWDKFLIPSPPQPRQNNSPEGHPPTL